MAVVKLRRILAAGAVTSVCALALGSGPVQALPDNRCADMQHRRTGAMFAMSDYWYAAAAVADAGAYEDQYAYDS